LIKTGISDGILLMIQ